MKIIVLSRTDAKKFTCDKPWACISISAGGDQTPPIILSEENRQDLLRINFDDIEYETYAYPYAFQPGHAVEIYNFVEKNKDVDVLMVHCAAGYSRSPAVAAAITKVVLKRDNQEYFTDTDKYYPNRRVYRMMTEGYNAGTLRS